MAVFKRKYRSGKTVWCFVIDAPGSSREDRRQIKESGFATKAAAEKAEAERRVGEQQRYELELAGIPDAPLLKTLADLLSDFFTEHAERKLARKTTERYREQMAYLHGDLLAMPITSIKPLHLAKEWNRLLESGGHVRRSGQPRPLSAKTVRKIAGVLSSAFARAIRWGLLTSNPVPPSEPPIPKRRSGAALTPAQQRLLIESATGCWCLAPFLEVSAATGARRGRCWHYGGQTSNPERYPSHVRSLRPKPAWRLRKRRTDQPGSSCFPTRQIIAIEAHRQAQSAFRRQFGRDYRTDLDLIFAEPDGNPLKQDSISSAVSALFKRLNIP